MATSVDAIRIKDTSGETANIGQLDAGALSTEVMAVDPTVVITVGDGTFAVEILASGADATANTVNELVTAGFNYGFNGTTWDRLRSDTTNGLDVDVTRVSGNVTVIATDLDIRNLTNTDVVTVEQTTAANLNARVVGFAGHDAAGAAVNPLATGGFASAAAPADVSADVDVVRAWYLRNGAQATVLTAAGALIGGDATNGLDVDVTRVGGNVTVVQSTPANLTATVTQGPAGTAWEVIGDVAHDAAAPANPVVTGGQMETQADSAPGTRAGTDGDAVKLAVTDGAQFVISGTPQQWSYHSDGSSALTDATVHSAPGAGLSLYVTTIVVSTGAATALNVFFEEGASKVLGPYYLEAVAGRGFVINFGVPKKITANTALTVTTSAAIAQAIDVTGFIAPG